MILSNQRGIALPMILVLSAISLAIMAGLVYMVAGGARISGGEKRYKTAFEAGMGAPDIAISLMHCQYEAYEACRDVLINDLRPINFVLTVPTTCTGVTQEGITLTGMAAKLYADKKTWSGCNNSISINPDDPSSYDMSFELGQSPLNYRVHVKIVDTLEGNTYKTDSGSGGGDRRMRWIRGAAVKARVNQDKRHWVYTVEIDAEPLALPTGKRERAKISLLYVD